MPLSLDAAAAALLSRVPGPQSGRAGTERVALHAAEGRVLARPAAAATDLPRFPRSLVDGFAVRAAEAGRPLRLHGGVRMGEVAPRLPPGTAMPIPTGGMLPDGADAVVMKEMAAAADGWLTAAVPVAAGANLIPAAGDAAKGDVVVPAGRRLRPFEIAMLATAGLGEAEVWCRPTIAVLSSGDELDPPGTPPSGARVPDANGPALMAALARDGCAPAWAGVVRDDREAVAAAVARCLDVGPLVCTGGTSVGERDFVGQVLEDALGPPLFSRLAVRPGAPTAAFASGDRWAVALPGHPASALLIYAFVAAPAVRLYAGERSAAPRPIAVAELAADVRAPADRELLARVRLDGGRAQPLAGPSAAVGHVASADGVVRCPAGELLRAGATVTVWLL